ncbi:MAG: hypothetical protein MHM6MM_003247 [Cercozoa sp. M6MM]
MSLGKRHSARGRNATDQKKKRRKKSSKGAPTIGGSISLEQALRNARAAAGVPVVSPTVSGTKPMRDVASDTALDTALNTASNIASDTESTNNFERWTVNKLCDVPFDCPSRLLWDPDVELDVPVTRSTKKAKATSPALELKRVQLLESLREYLEALLPARLRGFATASKKSRKHSDTDSKLPRDTFDRWRWRASLAEALESAHCVVDPVLPTTSVIDAQLLEALCEADLSQSVARDLIGQLNERSAALARQLCSQADTLRRQINKVKITERDSKKGGGDRVVELRCLQHSVSVRQAHYVKLRHLFRRHGASPFAEGLFRTHVFCLLTRYLGVSQTATGLQAAMHSEVFAVLKRRLDCVFECFASPLNCRYGRFCSAFPDVDRHFGSVGSFFELPLPSNKKVILEANPPFDDAFVDAFVSKVEALEGECALCVVVPRWQNSRAWQRLTQSACAVLHTVIPQKEHGFFDGAAHRRKQLWRLASFDTSVVWLHSRPHLQSGLTNDQSDQSNDQSDQSNDQSDQLLQQVRQLMPLLKHAFASKQRRERRVLHRGGKASQVPDNLRAGGDF